MKIDQEYRGPIRIIGKVGHVCSYGVAVLDVASGEQLDGVFRAEVLLDANDGINRAKLFYYETDETGAIVSNEEKKPVIHETTIEHTVVDVSALVNETEKSLGKPDHI